MVRVNRLFLLVVPFLLTACFTFDVLRARQVALEQMEPVIGADAVRRARIEVRPSQVGWMVVFRNADATCGEAPLWPGVCRFGPQVLRDVYACVDRDRWDVRQMGGVPSPQTLGAEDRCQNNLGGPPAPTSAPVPEPTAVPKEQAVD